ncbi:MAG: NADH oxidase [Blastocatellia bacterium]|nr:NADH oxidase [Blastocatellia bacterium]MBL8192294.1 NADH oxidase [Blastocatellia bacterium]
MTIKLSDKLTFACGIALPNRLVKSAMSEQLGDYSNKPTTELVRLYQRWADGGLGLSITGNVMIDRRALGEPCNVVVESEEDLAKLSEWAKVGKSKGGHIIMQINHPGRQSPTFVSSQPVAPSPVPVNVGRGMFAIPRALTEEEILNLIKRFANTARIAVKAGFSGVQIHAAHGYLISQFLSPLTNLRIDDWGGSAENRRRFILEVTREVRKAIGKDKILGVKLNSADFQKGGFTNEESMTVVQELEKEAIDFLEISGGTYEASAMIGDGQKESSKKREAYFLDYAQKVRKLVKLPLLLTGGFRTAKAMQEALAEGCVDLIGLARPLAVEPDLPSRILASNADARPAERHRVGIAMFDGFVELMWHTHQLHRMGAGKDPDLKRGAWPTLLAGLWENVWNSFRLKRSN